jgi:cell division protein FtsB
VRLGSIFKTENLTPYQRRLRLFVMLPLCILIVSSSVTIVDNMLIAADKKETLEQLEQELQNERRLQKHYQEEIIRLQDKEYREQQARTKFNMVKPGETMYTEQN